MYCWPDRSSGACSIQKLGQKMVDLGCVDAINYDGGGSCQCISYGFRGEGAKWVQWQLNAHGASLIVDGDFGNLSRNALITYQKKNGLTADGICGPVTRTALKRV